MARRASSGGECSVSGMLQSAQGGGTPVGCIAGARFSLKYLGLLVLGGIFLFCVFKRDYR